MQEPTDKASKQEVDDPTGLAPAKREGPNQEVKGEDNPNPILRLSNVLKKAFPLNFSGQRVGGISDIKEVLPNLPPNVQQTLKILLAEDPNILPFLWGTDPSSSSFRTFRVLEYIEESLKEMGITLQEISNLADALSKFAAENQNK